MTEIALALSLGLAAGVLSGLFGVGGGILFVPVLTLGLGLTQIHAEATSLLAIIPVAAVGAWRQAGYGNVRLADGIIVGLLSPVGVLAGAVISNNVPQRALEIGFAALLVFVAIQLVRRAFTTPAGDTPRGPARSLSDPRPDG